VQCHQEATIIETRQSRIDLSKWNEPYVNDELIETSKNRLGKVLIERDLNPR
jgi:hypothetical protein